MTGGQEVTDWLTRRLGEISGLAQSEVDPHRPFSEFGLSSQEAVALSGELEELTGLEVPATVVWEQPTIAALASWLASAPAAVSAPAVSAPAAARPAEGPSRGGAIGTDSVAVIGIGCRFPGGADGPDAFWRLLSEGGEAVRRVPESRFSGSLGTGSWAGLLDDVHGFDDRFFGIAPREAAAMDPQQRLLLEVSWEALEHAGLAAEALCGTDTGVFVGISSNEHAHALFAPSSAEAPEPHALTGSAMSVAANRLSYSLDLRGPSMAVDTACSSSLVAVHLAVRSLRSGECETAICGGVNVLLSGTITAAFDRAGAMAADGRSKAFSADADGYVRGEGCGVVVLKRLESALRDGDRVLAVIRGSAVGQDGRSNGLMAPRPEAQAEVIRRACRDAGVAPGDVDFVEAHGTGTLLGDPIEARALGEALGAGRPAERPLYVGSVKTNIGHLEAAAGIAGLIKTVLALWHRRLPRNLHFGRPNPHIPFARLGIEVVSRDMPWPRPEGRRMAGISSFGFGGTNAHVVVESASPAPVSGVDREGAPVRLLLGAPDRDRLAEAAERLAAFIEDVPGEVDLHDVEHTSSRRCSGRVRGAVVARSVPEALSRLRALANGREDPLTALGTATPAGAVWVFSGQGSQWPGMGRRLLGEEPIFAAAVDDLEPLFAAEAGFSLRDVLLSGRELTEIDAVQPVLFAVQVALSRLWRGHGAEPAAVIGHSVGEVAAAVVSGALDTADGLRVVVRRSRLMKRIAGEGAMAVIGLPARDADVLAARFPGVETAVYSSPSQTVLTGPSARIDALLRHAEEAGVPARAVAVDVASHSAQVEPLLAELESGLGRLTVRRPSADFYGTVLPDPHAVPEFDGGYWSANLRRPVRFQHAVEAALTDGHTVFVEIAPHPVLLAAIDEIAGGGDVGTVHTLRRGPDETSAFHGALALLQVLGLARPATRGRLIDLPTAAWRHRRPGSARPQPGTTEQPAGPPAPSPGPAAGLPGTLLGERSSVGLQPACDVWRSRLSPASPPYPGMHTVRGLPVVPASVLLGSLLAAAGELGRSALATVDLLRFVPLDRPAEVQVIARDEGLDLAVRPDSGSWSTHATSRMTAVGAPPPAEARRVLEDPGRSLMSPDEFERILSGLGIEGRAFPWRITEIARTGDHLMAEVRVGASNSPATAGGLPCALDAALQLAPLAGAHHPELLVPAHVEALCPVREPGERFRVLSRRRPGAGTVPGFDIEVTTVDGDLLLYLTGVGYARLVGPPSVTGVPAAQPIRTIEWVSRPNGPRRPIGTVVLPGTPHPLAEPIARYLEDEGVEVVLADDPATAASADAVVLLPSPAGGGGGGDTVDAVVQRCASAVEAIRSRAVAGHGRLWVLTAGVRAGAHAGLGEAPLWGLGQVMAAELPDHWGGIVDLDPDDSAETSAKAVVATLLHGAPDVTGVRDGVATRPEPVPLGALESRPPLVCDPDGVYVVTGGLGALGLIAAKHLAARGAKRLLLLARTPLPPRECWDDVFDEDVRTRINAVRALETAGVTVLTEPVDVGDLDALAVVLRAHAPIRGVVHAAGTAADLPVDRLDEQAMRDILHAKVGGADHLHRLFPPGDLDFLVLFSSAGALAGVPGQGAYAAANAYLDALAAHRSREGCHTVSIGWGPWRGLGMAVTSGGAAVRELMRRTGMRPLEEQEALDAWDRVHRSGVHHALVVAGAADDLLPRPPAALDRWAGSSATALRQELADLVNATVAEEMGTAAGDLESDTPLAEHGLDSIMAVAICRRLDRATGIRLPTTLLWRHPTTEAIIGHLEHRIGQELGRTPAPETIAPTTATPTTAAPTTAEPASAEHSPFTVLLDEIEALGGDAA
ncbi:type I polyketide synthase [Actinomadura sp. NTSP31]|uniref:type I polyketide synthase n=1 Tax=Actinomadura sp. NTSP31 TaxID=1735447 RepID=UPI0035C0E11A